jgi:hypothetical protein
MLSHTECIQTHQNSYELGITDSNEEKSKPTFFFCGLNSTAPEFKRELNSII